MIDDRVSRRTSIHDFINRLIEEVQNNGEIGISRFG